MPRPLVGVGGRVRALREALGLTQQAAARRAGLAQAHLSMIESGKRADPRASVLQALARALGVTVDELLRPFPADGAHAATGGSD